MSKSYLIYKDVAPGAEEDAAVTTNGAQPFTEPSKLPAGGDELPIISGELGAWGLNGTFVARDGKALAFWSTAMSGVSGVFSAPPTITVLFDKQYSSPGITLAFDTATGDHCTSVNIKWYQQATLKADADFAPNAGTYFCQQRVLSYDKVVITLKATNLPYRYAKLNQIRFGVYRLFGMTDLRRVSIINEMDLIASKLPVSTMRWTLDSQNDVEYLFQLQQPVEAYNDDRLIGVYYIESSSRVSERLYEISCHDAFGILNESTFAGGVYSNKSAAALLGEIVGSDFELEVLAADVKLNGAIQPCTRREAAQQVLFAWGACAATDGTAGIRVFSAPSVPAEIGTDRTFLGVAVDTAAITTEVRVTAHTYTESAAGAVEIGGVKYTDTTTVYTVTNPDVTATDKQNVVEVTEATLVSPAIAQAVAQRVYNYHVRRHTNKSRFVWKGERLGDCVTQPNSWGGTNTGNLVKMEILLSNTVVAGSEARGV